MVALGVSGVNLEGVLLGSFCWLIWRRSIFNGERFFESRFFHGTRLQAYSTKVSEMNVLEDLESG
jgi:hypothetical protein